MTLQEAERVVGAALRSNKAGIKAWAAAASPGQTKAFTYASASVVGRGVVRSTGKLVDMTNVVVVVRKGGCAQARLLRPDGIPEALILPYPAMAYTALSQFMGGWFHQDFDIEGNSVPEILGAFRAVTPLEEQRKLKSDIQQFLDDHPNDLDRAFEETFKPDIIASAFSGSTRGFLEEIRDLLDPAS